MKAASGLASGPQACPELAAEAVASALQRGGMTRAGQVVLLLSREFARQPEAALRLAVGTAGTLHLAGATVNGVFTEQGWQIDRPAAAALVLSDAVAAEPATLPVGLSGQGRLAADWQHGAPRAGLIDADGAAWQGGRPTADARTTLALPGRQHCLLARGLRRLGPAATVDRAIGHELLEIGGSPAYDHLCRQLPAELRRQVPLHQLCLLRDDDRPGIAVLSRHGDGALTLAEPVSAGQALSWALRQPLAAASEIREQFAQVAVDSPSQLLCALMLSCIGRGPLFYGDDDQDLLAFRERFPDVPLLGAYGMGQFVPGSAGHPIHHHAVLTLLHERPHVQSHP